VGATVEVGIAVLVDVNVDVSVGDEVTVGVAVGGNTYGSHCSREKYPARHKTSRINKTHQ